MTKQTIPVKITRDLEAEASIEEVIKCAVEDSDSLSALLLTLAQRICSPHPINEPDVTRTAIEAISKLNVFEAARVEEFGRFLLGQALIVDAVHRGQLVRALERGNEKDDKS